MVKIMLVLINCDGETLASLTKQNTQQKGKRRKKKKTYLRARSTKTQSGSQRGKGTDYVPKPPPIARSI
jgi:hypothetical protein